MEASVISLCENPKFTWDTFEIKVFSVFGEFHFVDTFEVLTITYINRTKVSSLNKLVSNSCEYFPKFFILRLNFKLTAEIARNEFKSLKDK